MPLSNLDEDALVALLLTLIVDASPVCGDWVFVALVSRQFRVAVTRAYQEAERRWMLRERLPGGESNNLVSIAGIRPHAFVTSLSGVVLSAKRFQFVKTHMREMPDMNVLFPSRAREAFLRVQYDPRSFLIRDNFAAYRLSLPLQLAMIKNAPLSMIRGSYFEVLGTSTKRSLDLSLPHHQALISYSAYAGRKDVLEWLVHSNPDRVAAFDCESCLVGLYKQVLSTAYSCTKHVQNEATLSLLNDLIYRAAAVGGSVHTIDWARDLMSELRRRFLGVRVPMTTHLQVPCMERAFVKYVCDAAAFGSTDLLSKAYEDCCGCRSSSTRYRILSFFVIVFKRARHSWKTAKWVLTRIQDFFRPDTLSSNRTTFDDFLEWLDIDRTQLVFGAIDAVSDLRSSVILAGDAGYNQWLLSEVQLAFETKEDNPLEFRFENNAFFLTSFLRDSFRDLGTSTLRNYMDEQRWSCVYCVARDLARQARLAASPSPHFAALHEPASATINEVRTVILVDAYAIPQWVPSRRWKNSTPLQEGAAEALLWMLKDALTSDWGIKDAQQLESWIDVLRIAPVACFKTLRKVHSHFRLGDSTVVAEAEANKMRRALLGEMVFEYAMTTIQMHASYCMSHDDVAKATCVILFVRFAHAQKLFNKRQTETLQTAFATREWWNVALTAVLGTGGGALEQKS